VLFAAGPVSHERGVVPTTTQVSAELSSRFVGSWIGDAWRSSLESPWSLEKGPFARKLRLILERCLEYLPADPAVHFRLGALSCLLREKDRALEEFRSAGRLLASSGDSYGTQFWIPAHDPFRDWISQKGYYDDELLLAQFAAYAAAAIFAGEGGDVRDMLEGKKETDKESAAFQVEYAMNAVKGPPIAFTVVQELLDKESGEQSTTVGSRVTLHASV
jgi:hypothetical protein